MRPDTQPGWKMINGRPAVRLVPIDHPQTVEAPWIDWSWQAFADSDAGGWPYLRYYNTVTGEEYWEMGMGNVAGAPSRGLRLGQDSEFRDAATGQLPAVGGTVPAQAMINRIRASAKARQAGGGRRRRRRRRRQRGRIAGQVGGKALMMGGGGFTEAGVGPAPYTPPPPPDRPLAMGQAQGRRMRRFKK